MGTEVGERLMVNIGLGLSSLLHAINTPPVLAQVAYGFGWGSLMGIALVLCGVALYLLRTTRPNLARDHDIFFAAVALLCGGILFFQGWRLDPILQFGQFLMTGSAVFFAVESIRMRGIVTQQAKRNAPIVDDERDVSPDYQSYEYEAELEELEPYEPNPPTRRIPGSRDVPRRSPRETYSDEPRRPPTRRSPGSPPSGRRPPSEGPPSRKRRPRPDAKSRQVDLKYSNWNDDETYDAPYGDTVAGPRPARRPPSRSSGPASKTDASRRRSRPPQDRPVRPKKQVEARLDDSYGDDSYSDFYADEPSPARSPNLETDRGDDSDYDVYDRTPNLRDQAPPVVSDDPPFPDDDEYGDRFGPNPYDDELEDDNSNQFDR
ncbi:MAG: Ycf66 protein N-terminus [Phormidium sp. OSCR]|nr:MAG: Ycf66 protein N-terminus [Phormidium sp. OSCR]